MNKYDKFEADLKLQKEENFKSLMTEVKNISNFIEKVISMALETSSAKAEREYHLQSF